ncbi:hypothetical protein DENSPDRAFT_884777, partial [Dentipellis sp. KUC8613]
MVNNIMMTQGISAEYSTIEEILAAIKQYESAQQFAKNAGHSHDTRTTARSGTEHASAAPRRVNNRSRPTYNTAYKGSGAATKGATSAPRDGTQTKCYACNQVGHISTDPKCPEYGKSRPGRPAMGGQGNHPRRMFAAQVVDERDSAEEEPTSQDPIEESEQDAADAAPDPIQSVDSEDENLVVGSQYDSEYELEQFEEYKEFSDESADIVYMRAGNVTTTPSLTDRP